MLTDNATTLPETQYEDLADLLESHPSSEDHQIDNATGRVQKNNKYGNPTGRQYSNVGEYIDVLLHKDAQKVANIINNFEDLTQAPAAPYIATATNVGDFVNQINTNATTLKSCVDNFLWLTPPATVTRCNIHATDKTLIEYEYNGATETVNVLELTEQLYLMQKISIANLNMVVQKLDRAQKRRERQANRGTNIVAPWAPAGSPGILQETHEDLYVPQIQAALNFSKINKKTGSAYSYDNKWFPVRYEKDATGVEKYFACIQDERGNVTEIDAPNTSTLIRNIMNTTKKTKEQIASPEIVDMENEFSQSKFMDLCEQVSKSKNKRGEYKLGGKSYIVREATPAQPARWLRAPRPATYNSQYLGHVNRTEEHVGNAQDLSQYLKQHIHFHAHAEWHHVLSKQSFLSTCEHIAHDLENNHNVVDNKVTAEYELGWHKYPVWAQKRNLGRHITSKLTRNPLRNVQFYAEVPNGLSTKIITSWSAEWLFNQIRKINEKSDHAHHDKPGESHAEKKSDGHHESKEHAHDEGHGDHHDEGKKSLYDKAVTGLLGNGLLGKAFIGTKNLIPAPLRNIAAGATKAGVSAGVVWGLLYGGSIAFWSAAAASAIVPAMGITFTVSSILRLLKWNKERKAGGGHDDGHGGH